MEERFIVWFMVVFDLTHPLDARSQHFHDSIAGDSSHQFFLGGPIFDQDIVSLPSLFERFAVCGNHNAGSDGPNPDFVVAANDAGSLPVILPT